jgi:hypothetical protein
VNDVGPRRNRVTPEGEIVAIALRGAWTGNRGILHRGQEIVRSHAHEHWLTCALEFKDRWHAQWQPHHLTWLFFHDEAVSFAAGHRPCALCRRPAYNRYRDAWVAATGGARPSHRVIDQQLHRERVVRGGARRTHARPWATLPDGAFVRVSGGPAVVVGPRLIEWTRAGYGAVRPRPWRGQADVLTPPSSLAVLAAGYAVQIDDTARGSGPGVSASG